MATQSEEEQRLARVWLVVEVVSAYGLHGQEWRFGDGALELIRGQRKLRPYVEIEVDGSRHGTHKRSEKIEPVDEEGFVRFGRRLCFPLLEEKVHEAHLEVFDLRKIAAVLRGDPLIGEAWFTVPEDLLPEEVPVEETVPLTQRRNSHKSLTTLSFTEQDLQQTVCSPAAKDSDEGISSMTSLADFLGEQPSSLQPDREASTDNRTSRLSSSASAVSGYHSDKHMSSGDIAPGCTGQIQVRFSKLDLRVALQVLSNTSAHSMTRVARAISKVMMIPDIADMFVKLRPKELGTDEEHTKKACQEWMEDLKEELGSHSNHSCHDSFGRSPSCLGCTGGDGDSPPTDSRGSRGTPVSEETDNFGLRQFAHISRKSLGFVANCLAANPGVSPEMKKTGAIEVASRWLHHWLCEISRLVLHEEKEYDPPLDVFRDSRIYRFFAAAEIEIQNLVPIDKSGNALEMWPSEAQLSRVNSNGSMSDEKSNDEVMASALENVPRGARLGTGSFGSVWRARDKHTGKEYAVKNMKVQGIEIVAQRECEIANHLCKEPHPCIVQTFGCGQFDAIKFSLFYIVMEICPGGDLSDRIQIQRKKAMKEEQEYSPPIYWRHWIGHIILGLEHLHLKMNTLLRDLKPENVVVKLDGTAKLTDFGFSRIGTESTGGFGTFGVPPGTPHYISPEVVRGEPYDSAADCYSLGVVIWVLMTGGVTNKTKAPVPPCLPFTTVEQLACNYKLLQKCIEDPANNNALPVKDADAKDLILALLQGDPAKRLKAEGIREHALVRPLNLPPHDSPYKTIENWIATSIQAVVNSS